MPFFVAAAFTYALSPGQPPVTRAYTQSCVQREQPQCVGFTYERREFRSYRTQGCLPDPAFVSFVVTFY